MEGTARCPWPGLRHRVDPGGLVLCRCDGGCLGPDPGPGVFQAHRRLRALAVPTGAQAWGPTSGRLAFRPASPASEVGQLAALCRLLRSVAALGAPPVIAGLLAVSGARGQHRLASVSLLVRA